MSARLFELQARLRRLQTRETELNNSLRILRRRRDDVNAVITQLSRAAGSNVSSANNEIRNTSQRMADGIRFPLQTSRIQAIFANREERDVSGDSHLSGADRDLRNEINRINNEIAAQERQLNQVRADIRTTNSEISAERARNR